MSKYTDIDAFLASGKEDELLELIKNRKAELKEAEAEEKKVKEEAEKKIHEEKVKKARESAIKAFKYYMETMLGTKVTDAEVQELVNGLIDLEKKIAKFNNLEKALSSDSKLTDEEKIKKLMDNLFTYKIKFY